MSIKTVFAQTEPSQTLESQAEQLQIVNESELILGEENEAIAKQTRLKAVSSFGATVRAFLVLAFVLGLAYVFLRFLRKISGQESLESRAIKIMASQTLKGTSALYIVEIARRIYILGVADAVNLISEVTDKEAADELRLQLSQQPPKQTFGQMLRGKLALQGLEPKLKTALNAEEQAQRLRQLLPKQTKQEGEEGPDA